jgi:ParB-like chromosome segregation protein Spo0J
MTDATKPAIGLPDGAIPDFLRRTEEVDPNTLEVHPIAMIFPRLDDAAVDQMALDIRNNGQQQPISLYEGKVLEGVNRTEACKRLKCKVKARQYLGNDPIGFVLSANLHRRHLDASQRAIVGAKLADLGVGDNQTTKGSGTSIEVAAKLVNVGRASIERALTVLRSGDTKLIEEVKTGEVSVSAAANAVAAQTPAKKASKKSETTKSKVVTPETTKQSDNADELVDKLIGVLKQMKPELQEALLIGMFKRFRDAGYILDLPTMAIKTEEEVDEEEDGEKEAA